MFEQSKMLTNKRKGDGKRMIKIIEHGTITKQKCNTCGCLFSYESEDVITERDECMLHGFDEDYIICPQCNTKIKLGGTK